METFQTSSVPVDKRRERDCESRESRVLSYYFRMSWQAPEGLCYYLGLSRAVSGTPLYPLDLSSPGLNSCLATVVNKGGMFIATGSGYRSLQTIGQRETKAQPPGQTAELSEYWSSAMVGAACGQVGTEYWGGEGVKRGELKDGTQYLSHGQPRWAFG